MSWSCTKDSTLKCIEELFKLILCIMIRQKINKCIQNALIRFHSTSNLKTNRLTKIPSFAELGNRHNEQRPDRAHFPITGQIRKIWWTRQASIHPQRHKNKYGEQTESFVPRTGTKHKLKSIWQTILSFRTNNKNKASHPSHVFFFWLHNDNAETLRRPKKWCILIFSHGQ